MSSILTKLRILSSRMPICFLRSSFSSRTSSSTCCFFFLVKPKSLLFEDPLSKEAYLCSVVSIWRLTRRLLLITQFQLRHLFSGKHNMAARHFTTVPVPSPTEVNLKCRARKKSQLKTERKFTSGSRPILDFAEENKTQIVRKIFLFLIFFPTNVFPFFFS